MNMNEYYVLERDDKYQIVSITKGNNPLYGYGSCDLFSGPFNTFQEAADSVTENNDSYVVYFEE